MTSNIIEILKKKNIQLTEQQQKSILHESGSALVLAVPGSGKTTTIMGRIGHLIHSGQARADNILAITFSKASAIDMTDRFQSFFSEEDFGDVRFSTIHAFGNWVVGQYNKQFGIQERLITQKEAYSAIKKSYTASTGEYLTEENLDSYITAIGFIKNRLLKNEKLQDYCRRSDLKALQDVLLGYESYKKDNHLYDYDDMLIKTIKILNSNTTTREFFQKKYKHICVDEVQDTSILQHQLIRLLVNSDSNIFMVGDDNQSIYGFRGADNRIILNINELYPNTKCYLMDENFRSTKNITDLANIAIEENKNRYDKKIHSNKDKGEKINIVYAKDVKAQAKYVIDNIDLNKYKTAILYRNNISLISLAHELRKRNIDFCAKNYKPGFFNHWVVNDVLSIIKFMLNEVDVILFSKIYYKIETYLSKKTVLEIQKLKGENESVLDFITENCQLGRRQMATIRNIKATFKRVKEMEPCKGIEHLLGFLGYYNYLDKTASDNKVSVSTFIQMIEVIKDISKDAKKYEDVEIIINKLNEDIWKSVSNSTARLHLCTLHSSKGLEFDDVYIINVDDGVLPAPPAKNATKEEAEAQTEEEIRLLYVGITRAKNKLSIINTDGKESKFLKAIKRNEDLVNILKVS